MLAGRGEDVEPAGAERRDPEVAVGVDLEAVRDVALGEGVQDAPSSRRDGAGSRVSVYDSTQTIEPSGSATIPFGYVGSSSSSTWQAPSVSMTQIRPRCGLFDRVPVAGVGEVEAAVGPEA